MRDRKRSDLIVGLGLLASSACADPDHDEGDKMTNDAAAMEASGPTPTACAEEPYLFWLPARALSEGELSKQEKTKYGAHGCVNFGSVSDCTSDARGDETVCRSSGGPNAGNFERIRIAWHNNLDGDAFGESAGRQPVYLAKLRPFGFGVDRALNYFQIETTTDWLLYVPTSPVGSRTGTCHLFDANTSGIQLCVP